VVQPLSGKRAGLTEDVLVRPEARHSNAGDAEALGQRLLQVGVPPIPILDTNLHDARLPGLRVPETALTGPDLPIRHLREAGMIGRWRCG
jgi:hypothetical protein